MITRRVVVESPLAAPSSKLPCTCIHDSNGGVVGQCPRCLLVGEEMNKNVRYARAALLDCLHRGEAPFASHLLYTQVLDDDAAERKLGMEAGFAWGAVAEACVVYTDLGTSKGMEEGISRAKFLRIPVEYRQVPGWTDGSES